MTDHLTADEVLAAVPGLTPTRLAAFVESELITPLRREDAAPPVHVFRRVDCARLHLIFDLTEGLELDDTALDVVITLIDQLHATRRDLLAIARAVDAETPEVRARIGSAIVGFVR